MTLFRVISVSLLAVTLSLVGGCVTVLAAGGAASGIAYAKGDLEGVLVGTPREVAVAAKAALEDMGLRVLTSNTSELDGEVTSRSSRDKKITINFKRMSDVTTEISIRVGTFGDEALSRAIYDRIKVNL